MGRHGRVGSGTGRGGEDESRFVLHISVRGRTSSTIEPPRRRKSPISVPRTDGELQRKAGAMPRVSSRPDGQVERGFEVTLWKMGQTRLRGDCHLCEPRVANSLGEAPVDWFSVLFSDSKMSNYESMVTT